MRLEIEKDNYLLVIDKNVYNDITDYNLEIEANDSIESAKKILSDYIKKFNLTHYNEKYVGKAHRAIDSVIKNN